MFGRLVAKAREEGGIALVAVIVLGAVMIVIAGTALGVVSSGLTAANTDQNATGALDAAYAGVQDYVARANADSTYPQYGNPASAYSTSTGSTVTLPSTTNAAFGVGSSGTWATVPGSSGASSFRYEVDNHLFASSGLVTLRVTGRVGQVTRSVTATVKQQGFPNWLYFTDMETFDPAVNYTSGCNLPTDGTSLYLWNGRNSTCTSIQFAATDTIAGPVHSNDTMTVCGNPFTGSVTSSNPTSPIYVDVTSGCSSTANPTITYSAKVSMPSTNGSMKTQTDPSTATGTAGCLYTGPTSITFNGDGTMTVVSPWTKATNVNSTTNAGTAPAQCGSISALQSTSGATINVLPSNLVYVQSVPTVSTDPNYTATTSKPTNFSCLAANGTSTITGSSGSAGWSFGSTRYPATGEIAAYRFGSVSTTGTSTWNTTASLTNGGVAYGCRNGDVFVKGAISGRMTIGADNYVYVTGDITYVNSATDLLGLVGNNAVIVWNPMKGNSTSESNLLTDSGRTIDAAIVSVAHTFMVQNWSQGSSRGTLTVLGSIAQKYRGAVATTSGGSIATGYRKNYSYDSRLVTTSPPFFLAPSSTYFSITRYAGVPAAFTAAGVAR